MRVAEKEDTCPCFLIGTGRPLSRQAPVHLEDNILLIQMIRAITIPTVVL